MKLLLDECVPKRLKNDLEAYETFTVNDIGFKGLTNGQLLTAAVEQGFEVILSVDKQMPFQQKLESFNLALIVLVANPCRYPQLKLLVPRILETLETISPGEVVIIQ